MSVRVRVAYRCQIIFSRTVSGQTCDKALAGCNNDDARLALISSQTLIKTSWYWYCCTCVEKELARVVIEGAVSQGRRRFVWIATEPGRERAMMMEENERIMVV